MTHSLPLSLALLLLSLTAPAYAQVDPSFDPLPLPEPLPEEPALESPEPSTVPDASEDTTPIAVTQIQIQGSTVFSAADLAELVAPYENRTLTFGELQALAQLLNQRYLEAGYITTQVRIPEQVITDGIVVIEVLEGELAEIIVTDESRYRDYITSRLNLASTAPLSQPELEAQLQLLQLGGLFDTVSAQLQAGDGPGTSRLTVSVEEANPFQGEVFVDNYSPRSVGETRVGSRLSYRSLLALGDTLSLAVTTTQTEGAQAYTLGYQVPVSPQDATVRLGFSYENFRITDDSNPIFNLGIRGNAQVYEAEFRYPLIRSPQEELALGLGFRHRDGQSVILGAITFPNRTSVLQFSQDYLRRDGSGAWVARSQFNLGTDWFDATLNPDPQPDGQFLSWLGQVQRVQRLNPDNLLIVRADLQLSGDSLLGSEQFVIGGGQSVRGYRQNVRSGDGGLRLSVENRIVVNRRLDGSPRLQLVPFMDWGAVWFNNPATQPTQQNVLWGTGLGVIFTPLSGLEARLEAGIPLINLREITDQGGGAQLHFSLGYRW